MTAADRSPIVLLLFADQQPFPEDSAARLTASIKRARQPKSKWLQGTRYQRHKHIPASQTGFIPECRCGGG